MGCGSAAVTGQLDEQRRIFSSRRGSQRRTAAQRVGHPVAQSGVGSVIGCHAVPCRCRAAVILHGGWV